MKLRKQEGAEIGVECARTVEKCGIENCRLSWQPDMESSYCNNWAHPTLGVQKIQQFLPSHWRISFFSDDATQRLGGKAVNMHCPTMLLQCAILELARAVRIRGAIDRLLV